MQSTYAAYPLLPLRVSTQYRPFGSTRVNTTLLLTRPSASQAALARQTKSC
jgi:hypothetical protein